MCDVQSREPVFYVKSTNACVSCSSERVRRGCRILLNEFIIFVLLCTKVLSSLHNMNPWSHMDCFIDVFSNCCG